MSNIHYGAATDTGRQREHNEDSCFLSPDDGLFIVADGMGGHYGGEIASALATQVISNAIKNGRSLTESIEEAHQAIIDAGLEDQNTSGMGTTVVALRLEDCDYEIAWVGDSRAYLYDGGLKQLTRDHSFVQQMIDAGALSVEEARDHPDASVLSQALGALDIKNVEVGRVHGRLFANQKILLCSDGLTSELGDATIAAILQTGGSEKKIVDRLIETANEQGGGDNITVVLISAPPEAVAKRAKGGTRPMDITEINRFLAKKKPRRHNPKLFFVAIFCGFFFLALLAGIYLWAPPEPPPVTSSGSSGKVLSPATPQAIPDKLESTDPMQKTSEYDDALPGTERNTPQEQNPPSDSDFFETELDETPQLSENGDQ